MLPPEPCHYTPSQGAALLLCCCCCSNPALSTLAAVCVRCIDTETNVLTSHSVSYTALPRLSRSTKPLNVTDSQTPDCGSGVGPTGRANAPAPAAAPVLKADHQGGDMQDGGFYCGGPPVTRTASHRPPWTLVVPRGRVTLSENS